VDSLLDSLVDSVVSDELELSEVELDEELEPSVSSYHSSSEPPTPASP
jgi:hypothetical protein